MVIECNCPVVIMLTRLVDHYKVLNCAQFSLILHAILPSSKSLVLSQFIYQITLEDGHIVRFLTSFGIEFELLIMCFVSYSHSSRNVVSYSLSFRLD